MTRNADRADFEAVHPAWQAAAMEHGDVPSANRAMVQCPTCATCRWLAAAEIVQVDGVLGARCPDPNCRTFVDLQDVGNYPRLRTGGEGC